MCPLIKGKANHKSDRRHSRKTRGFVVLTFFQAAARFNSLHLFNAQRITSQHASAPLNRLEIIIFIVV